jgi:acetylornithine deacetylase/succinyl-diaminopimelate desuccinylase-like protein
LERTISSVVPDAIVAPYLPLRLASRDLERMHGVNERVDIGDYANAIRIYRQVIVETTNRPHQ